MSPDVQWLASIFAQGTGMGVGIGGALVTVRSITHAIFGRLDHREAHIDAATKGLIDELRTELNRLKTRADEAEERMRECEKLHRESQRELDETRAELLKVQRLLQAGGEIRNQVQSTIAAEKLLGDGRKK
jgi:hypothetical protein